MIAKIVKRRRGTTAEHQNFKGFSGEITIDTDKKTVVVHDGITLGGFPLQHEIKDEIIMQAKNTGNKFKLTLIEVEDNNAVIEVTKI